MIIRSEIESAIHRLMCILFGLCVYAYTQGQIIESISNEGVYELLDELVSYHVIDANPAIKPYSRRFIASRLHDAQLADSLLSHRLRKEVAFYLNDYALELDTLPSNWVQYTHDSNLALSLAQPSLQYSNAWQVNNLHKRFTMMVRPVLGAQMTTNMRDVQTEHRWGAEIQMDICSHLSIWGKLFAQSNVYHPKGSGFVEPIYEWSHSTGGISLYTWWGSIGLQKEAIRWGNAQYASIIQSGIAPSFPMLTLKLTPARWLEFNYFHAWLTPDAIDTTFFPPAEATYMPERKYMAANMITFMPIKYLELSFGNSIVYAERNIQLAYLIPIAFYKSLDHLLTKGVWTQNQNSQMFLTLSTRNLKHLYVYGSLFVDEFELARLKKSNPETNPLTYQVGLAVQNWPLDGLRLRGEFMRSYIASYVNQVNALYYSSGESYLGHPLRDNAQSIYAEIGFKPIRGLDLLCSYTNDTRFNQYHSYYRDGSLARKSFDEKVWRNQIFELRVRYEIFNRCYASVVVKYNFAQGFAPTSEPIDSEDRGQKYKEQPLTGDALAEYYITKYSSLMERGRNVSLNIGLYYNF